MKRSHQIAGCACLTALAISRTARAGPPFVTDDPEPVELGHWEFYVASQFRHEHAGNNWGLPSFEVNYGAAPDLQLHLIAPFALDAPTDASSHYGYGDTELGAKFRFVKETDTRPQVGVFPLVELPTGDEDRGLGSGKTQLFLPIWVQKSWDDKAWTTYGGGGWHSNPGAGNRDFWQFGWELQRNISDTLSVGGELYYFTKDTDDGKDSIGFNLGAIINLTENHHILFSAGRDFDGPNLFSAYVAYQLTF